MPYVTVTVLVTSDVAAQPQQIFEKRLRIFLTQENILNFQKAGSDAGGVFSAMPSIEQSAALNCLILATDVPVNFKLASVAPADGIIALKAGGLLMALDCNIASGKTTNAAINNTQSTGGIDGAGTATITGVAGGGS